MADRDVAGGDRPEALLGVEAVGLDVERVVQEVGAARREAERDERDERVEDGVALAEDAGRGGGGDDEDVLDPLLRAGLVEQRRGAVERRGSRPGSSSSARAGTGTGGISAASAMRRLVPSRRKRPGNATACRRSIRPACRIATSRSAYAEPASARSRTPPRPSRRCPWPSSTPRPRPGARRRRPGLRARRRRRVRRARPARRGARRGGGRRPRRGRRPVRRAGRHHPRASASSAASADVGRRLEVRRVAVVPAAEQPPHVADDELGLVVDRAEVRLGEQLGRARVTVWTMSSRRAPSFIIRIVSTWRCSSSARRVGERRRAPGRHR